MRRKVCTSLVKLRDEECVIKKAAYKSVAPFLALLTVCAWTFGQSLTPPSAEYRGKAKGMLTLRNNTKVPLVAILEVRGFSIDSQGELAFRPLDPDVRVDFGASSFTIYPGRSRFVFYKASAQQLPAWFAIVSTLVRRTRVKRGLRINIVLPHFVYLEQKQKLKESDVEVEVLPGGKAGEYRIGLKNLSDKLGRVASIEARGFARRITLAGFPVFPQQTRWLILRAKGPQTADPELRVRFRDGVHFTKQFSRTAVPAAQLSSRVRTK